MVTELSSVLSGDSNGWELLLLTEFLRIVRGAIEPLRIGA